VKRKESERCVAYGTTKRRSEPIRSSRYDEAQLSCGPGFASICIPETQEGRSSTSSSHTGLKLAEFEQELEKLHVELVKLQEWVEQTGAKIVVLFEGRDAAGKGGVIKRITERVSPRVFRVVALPAPTEREKSQIYIQRYVAHLPAAGEIAIFDRSWYNRPLVERVMGFCTEEQAKYFLKNCPSREIPREKVKLPKRQKPKGYKELEREVSRIPMVY